MKYYALKYPVGSDECSILFETESESITETMKLVKLEQGFEYEVVSETEILEEINKYYDTEMLVH